MVNKIIIVGRIGADPEVNILENDKKRAEFSVATSSTFKRANGEKQEETDWHRVECWNGLADIVQKYCKRGQQVCIEGRQRHTSYENQQGEKKTRSFISAHEIKILTPKNE